MNYISLIGRLVYDPEIKTTKSGTNYTPIRIAVDRRDKNRSTDFLNCRAWNKTAEFIVRYFKKGDPIWVIGSLQNDNYERQDGSKVQDLVVMISDVGFVPKPSGRSDQAPAEPQADEAQEPGPEMPFEI